MHMTNMEKAILAALLAAHGASARAVDKSPNERNPFAKFATLGEYSLSWTISSRASGLAILTGNCH